MTVQAALAVYRDEFIAGFEQTESLIAASCLRNPMVKGLTATFLVASSGGATAVTRGQNGAIPYGTPSNTQVTATLVEKHATQSLTGFDIFASQGPQVQIMHDAAMSTIRRDQDLTVLTELANATQDYGTGNLDLNIVTGAKAILGVNYVDTSEIDNMFCVISPAAEAYLLQTTEFTSADYVDVKPLTSDVARSYRRWMGVNWVVSPLVTGVGTSSETLYMYHRNSIGYALNQNEIMFDADYDRKQRESWAVATIYHAAKITQNTGIIKITHDGSAFVAT